MYWGLNMFEKWLKDNNVTQLALSNRLFPPASDRVYWQKVITENYVGFAEAYLNYEWPLIRASQYIYYHTKGNREAQEDPHFARRRALKALFLGELAEDNGRFLPDICDGIFVICEESYWGVSAHASITKGQALIPDATDPYIDLFAAETAELLAVIYHIMYDKLYDFCPEILQRIENELYRRIITPYLNRGDFWWMGNTRQPLNNWTPWILSNILTVFCVCDLRKTDFVLGIKKMFQEINRYYKVMPEDGGCDEGPVYWSVSAGKLFSFCDVLYVMSDGHIDFFKDTKLHHMAQYITKAYINEDFFANFSDSNARMDNMIDYELCGLGIRTGDGSFIKLARNLKLIREKNNHPIDLSRGIKSILFALHYSDIINAQTEFVPQDIAILPNIQHAFIREGEWYYAIKGGHNAENHNHVDVGNYIIYHHGNPVIIDVGCATYTKDTFTSARYSMWMMRSGGHNLPIINGFEEGVGRQYCAEKFIVDNKTSSISFASAYTKDAGVTQLSRKITFCNEGITLQDYFEFNNDANTIEERFMTLLKPEITDAGVVLGGRYLIKNSFQCKIVWQDFNDDKKLKAAWGTEGIYCISLSTHCGRTGKFQVEFMQLNT